MSPECVFCRIGSGEIESEVLYRDNNCFVIKDIAPKAPVHLLVIPNLHFTNLKGLTMADYSMVGGMFATAGEMAGREGVANSGYRLVINQGDDAGQALDHLHIHVIGGTRLDAMA